MSSPIHTPASSDRSLATTLFFETFSLLVVTVLLMGVSGFFLARHALELGTISGLQSAVYARENILESTISRQRTQVAILGRDPVLTHLQSVTGLVGFQALLRVDAHGVVRRLAGTGSDSIDRTVLTHLADTEHTIFLPIFREIGWASYLIASPSFDVQGHPQGALVALFSPRELMARLFATEYVGQSAEVLLAMHQGDGFTVLHADSFGNGVPVRMGGNHEAALMQHSFAGEQGVKRTEDYAGISVLSAYRTLPSIGWTVIVQVDASEVTSPILRLAMNLVGIGLLLVCLLSLSTFFLSRRITDPLQELARKLHALEVHHWHFTQTIFTGDELEIVDRAADDLTRRLRDSYDHLEEIVHERTKALLERNARDIAILENIEYGLLMTDEKGRIVYMNRAGEILTRRTSAFALCCEIVINRKPVVFLAKNSACSFSRCGLSRLKTKVLSVACSAIQSKSSRFALSTPSAPPNFSR